MAKGVADPIPTQSGNAGKALVTNGSAVSWGDGGAWTAIAKGTGPSSAVTSISIDNICFLLKSMNIPMLLINKDV